MPCMCGGETFDSRCKDILCKSQKKPWGPNQRPLWRAGCLRQVEALGCEAEEERVAATWSLVWSQSIPPSDTIVLPHLPRPWRCIHPARQSTVDETGHDWVPAAVVPHQTTDPPSHIETASPLQPQPPQILQLLSLLCLLAGASRGAPLFPGLSKRSLHHLSQSALGMWPGHLNIQVPGMVFVARYWSSEERTAWHRFPLATAQAGHEPRRFSLPRLGDQRFVLFFFRTSSTTEAPPGFQQEVFPFARRLMRNFQDLSGMSHQTESQSPLGPVIRMASLRFTCRQCAC